MKCEYALAVGSLLSGTQQDQYEVLSVLGVGGFGITYKARDHLLHSDVAIKEYLPLDLAIRDVDGVSVKPRTDAEQYDWGLKSFLNEARTLSRFKAEPNIVRVENFLPANGTAYMVMQYEEGKSLSEYLAQHGVLDEQQLIAILYPVLDGLRAIHGKGFLHRDIKPGNIYLRKNGTPILIDFGAARQALGESSCSVTGILTAGYAPFEQYSTRANLSAATDLYSFGATLYKCITGQVPIEATERINALHNEELDPLVNASKLSKKKYHNIIYECIDWMLQPLAKDRPKSAAEVIERLKVRESLLSTSVNDELTHSGEFADAKTRAMYQASTENNLSKVKNTHRETVGQSKWMFFVLLVLAVTAGLFVFEFGVTDSASVKSDVMATPSAVASDSVVVSQFDQAKKYYFTNQFAKALILFKQLAQQNHARSEYYLSELWLNGYGVEKNNNQSQYWLKRAFAHGLIAQLKMHAARGKSDSQSLLGQMYFRGTGVSKDYNTAIHWIRQAAFQGDALAELNLGYLYENALAVTRDYKQAVTWYQKSALQGNSMAESNLGTMYSLGRGVSINYKQGVYWYRRSAKQGNAQGQVNLGYMYSAGRGLKKNLRQAIFWYQKSAQQGNLTAQYNLAHMYANGIGIKKNAKLAIFWYQHSALQNNSAAQNALAFYYKKGIDIPKNENIAVKWYRRSAISGNAIGQFNLGLMYASGLGLEKNDKRAVYWFRQSAIQENVSGQRSLGIMYEAGRGVMTNYSTALIWYNKALAKGSVDVARDIHRVKRKQASLAKPDDKELPRDQGIKTRFNY
ncbi:Serine/threonine protein kinase [hydrothermal vent metagenome]|uniref:Serine/threonine protein kinase n=1 Tax=hydrothermal vent metagenome TaxID=652676 RepID=A0A3B0YMP3_9ZZZZ